MDFFFFFHICSFFSIFFFYHHNLDSHHLTSGERNTLQSHVSPNIHSVVRCSINLLKSCFCCVIPQLTFQCFPIASIILSRLLTNWLFNTSDLSLSSLRVCLSLIKLEPQIQYPPSCLRLCSRHLCKA